MRHHDARHLTSGELARARRELAASMALSRPGSPIRAPIQAQLSAIDTEVARRRPQDASTAAAVGRCSCGFATSDYEWLAGHISEKPGHHLAGSYGNWEPEPP